MTIRALGPLGFVSLGSDLTRRVALTIPMPIVVYSLSTSEALLGEGVGERKLVEHLGA